MQIKILLLFSLIICCNLSYAQNGKLLGTIYDASSKNPLAFVTVVIIETNVGRVTDIDGKFSFLKTPEKCTLKISYIGYASKELVINKSDSNVIIELVPENKNLEAVIIGNGENPAHRIIKLLLENKNKNNPALLPSFKYNAYTISTIGVGNAFAAMATVDTSKKTKKTASAKEIKSDSIALEKIKKFTDNFLMVTESYVERKFRYPNRSKETVLASKVSGLKQAPFAITTSSFQPFGFYKEFLQIGIDNYISPLVKGSISLYNFKLKETLINTNDTSFIIQFEPRKNKNFKGLKGLLYINSDGYAIENVIASAAEKKGAAFDFKIQQQYERINGKWFPKQLNTHISQKTINSDSTLFNWDSRSYLTNTSIGDVFPLSIFSDVEQVFNVEAGKIKENEWKKIRLDSLTIREKATYKTYEDLPAKTLNKFNALNKFVTALSLNAIPRGKVDIPFKYFINGINKYEGFRIGGGLQTNPTFNKYFSLGAFAGYGVKDNAWKYGGNIQLLLKERTVTNITFSYEQNLSEPGNVDYFFNKSSVLFNQSFRKFLASRMDSIKQFKIDFTSKVTPSLQTNIWIQNENRNPAGYNYLFENKKGEDVSEFRNTEIGLGFRYTKGEKYIKLGRAKILNKPATAQYLLQISKGLNDVWKGDFDYTKLAVQVNRIINSKTFGQTNIQIEAGQIWGNLPYSYLFNTKSSSSEKKSTVFIPNTFQTVGLYEFVSTQTASLFLQNDFASLLFKPKNFLFRPNVLFIQSIGFGNLKNASLHKLINVKSPSKGLYESGIMIKNIYKKNILNTFYLGIGAGFFYRYGYYQLDKPIDNWAFKFGLNFSF